eukprot:3246127-Amphidinium_carterae.6
MFIDGMRGVGWGISGKRHSFLKPFQVQQVTAASSTVTPVRPCLRLQTLRKPQDGFVTGLVLNGYVKNLWCNVSSLQIWKPAPKTRI